jgi:hypothetical protein
MGRVRAMRRAAAMVLVAAAAAGAWATTASATASASSAPDTVVEQPFAADSGDACQYGVTKGKIFWQLGPLVGPSSVGVTGALSDRPVPGEPATCRDDRKFTVLTVTAYAGSVAVDEELVRANNGVRDYRFVLQNETSRARIDRLVVVVCRHAIEVGIPGYCGERHEFRAPIN